MSLTAGETRVDASAGFPSGLRPAARGIIAALAAGESHAPAGAFTVAVDGESLLIPRRLYYEPALLRRKLEKSGGVEQRIVACLGTRHHDGYLRQHCLQYLHRGETAWTIPYIVQLAGEYVVEIVDEAAAIVASCEPLSLAAFARHNAGYVDTLDRRVTSYWNAYYRHAFPDRRDYPGSKVIASLRGSLGEIQGHGSPSNSVNPS